MKNIVFTICSNNYLSQAKVLSDSIFENGNDTYDCYIVLCDRLNEKIDYSEFHASFVEVSDLGIANFDWMTRHYNIIELNTAVKPYAFQYLIKKHNPQYIHYLDPDICTYAPLTTIEKELGEHSMLLTPHTMAPLGFDEHWLMDTAVLNVGIYNLGFLGLKVNDDSNAMLAWWADFLAEHCLINGTKGLFVDQLPMNLAPLFFNGVKVSSNKGLNAAYWNLHERKIQQRNGTYYADDDQLIFYHFSNFSPSTPTRITGIGDKYCLDDFPDLRDLFSDYVEKRNNTRHAVYESVPCVYVARGGFFRKVMKHLALKVRNKADDIFVKYH